MIQRLMQPGLAAHLFRNNRNTAVRAVLAELKGAVYAPTGDMPESAVAILGDFCFPAGKPSEELIRFCPAGRAGNFIIIVPPDAAWAGLIRATYGEAARETMRFALRHDEQPFDIALLARAAAELPQGYSLRDLDEELFHRSRRQEWCCDWTSQFDSYGEFSRNGLGVAAMRGDEIVAGASSYYPFPGGIEIQIDTHADHRRKGLAFACAARLILRCLERGLYPGWDAQNPASCALAEKLGYHMEHAYPAFEVSGYGCAGA